MLGEVVDIVIKAVTQLEDIKHLQQVIGELEKDGGALTDAFSKAFNVESIKKLTDEYVKLQEQAKKSIQEGDTQTSQASERRLRTLELEIEQTKKILAIEKERDEVLRKMIMVKDPSLSIVEESAWKQRMAAEQSALSLLETGTKLIRQETRTAREEEEEYASMLEGVLKQLRKEQSPEEPPPKSKAEEPPPKDKDVSWSIGQTIKDELVRGVMHGIERGFTTMASMTIGRAFGGTSFWGILGAAAGVEEQLQFGGAPIAAAMGLLGGGYNPARTTDKIRGMWKGMMPFGAEYGMTAGETGALFAETTGWMPGKGRESVTQRQGALEQLLGLLQYGISPQQAAAMGGIAQFLTGGGGVGATGQAGWLNAIMGQLTGGQMVNGQWVGGMGQTGQGLGQWLGTVQQMAQFGGGVSMNFAGADIAQNIAMMRAMYEETPYAGFMLAQGGAGAMQVMQRMQAPFMNPRDDAMRAFMMRAYGYGGGGIGELAGFERQMQQGFLGEGGTQNLMAVYNQLMGETGMGGRSSQERALIMSRITGIGIDQLTPVMDILQGGGGDMQARIEEYRKQGGFEFGAGKAITTQAARDRAQREEVQREIGTEVNNLLTALVALLRPAVPVIVWALKRLVELTELMAPGAPAREQTKVSEIGVDIQKIISQPKTEAEKALSQKAIEEAKAGKISPETLSELVASTGKKVPTDVIKYLAAGAGPQGLLIRKALQYAGIAPDFMESIEEDVVAATDAAQMKQRNILAAALPKGWATKEAEYMSGESDFTRWQGIKGKQEGMWSGVQSEYGGKTIIIQFNKDVTTEALEEIRTIAEEQIDKAVRQPTMPKARLAE